MHSQSFNNLINGHKKFKNTYFSQHKDEYDVLVKDGQHPGVLFIGCSDSRVVPDLIVNTKPGDMFIIRNIGNFVPTYIKDSEYRASSAAIEYAVCVLEVTDIIVCGHSYCGACAALYEDLSHNKDLLHVNKWLNLGKEAKKFTLDTLGKNANKEEILRHTEKYSIKYQLQHLLTYPKIKQRVLEHKLEIHGWYYKIEDGSIEFYDQFSDSYKALN